MLDTNCYTISGSLYGEINSQVEISPETVQTKRAISFETCLAKNHPKRAYDNPVKFMNSHGVKTSTFEILHPAMNFL